MDRTVEINPNDIDKKNANHLNVFVSVTRFMT